MHRSKNEVKQTLTRLWIVLHITCFSGFNPLMVSLDFCRFCQHHGWQTDRTSWMKSLSLLEGRTLWNLNGVLGGSWCYFSTWIRRFSSWSGWLTDTQNHGNHPGGLFEKCVECCRQTSINPHENWQKPHQATWDDFLTSSHKLRNPRLTSTSCKLK